MRRRVPGSVIGNDHPRPRECAAERGELVGDAGAVALVVSVWLLIAITLVSGHDPALARKSSGTTASATSRRHDGSSSFLYLSSRRLAAI